MKKIMSIVIVLSMLALGSVAKAQGGFILGLGVGLLFGDGGQASSGSSANIVYTMAKASERVKEPLQIKQIVISVNLQSREYYAPGDDVGLSLKDIFGKAVNFAKNFKKGSRLKSVESYEILQVMRLFNGDGTMYGLLFTFIEKAKVIPLDQLPEPKQ